MNKLKLITTENPSQDNVLYIEGGESNPVLTYDSNQTHHVLDKGGSDRVNLLTCSELKNILDRHMFKGTKYIISTYNPTLYYLFPGVTSNDNLFNSDNDFIPTLPISDLVRMEVDGFNEDSVIKQKDVRCMKACDSWFNDLEKYEEIVEDIDTRVNSIFGYYKEFEVAKEVKSDVGDYSVDLSGNPIVVSLISGSTYTDTINLEDWVLGSKKGSNTISGKLDISFMYSIGGEIYSGEQTIKAFQYEENIISKNTIITFESVQLEYMDYVLKIYPLSVDVDEVVFTDCTLTIGVL